MLKLYIMQKDESDKAKKHLEDLRTHVVEELGDVTNLIGQFRLLFEMTDEEVNQFLVAKVDRTYADMLDE
jgi:hypothetical protein